MMQAQQYSGQGAVLGQPAHPQESFTQVIDTSLQKLVLIEQQVDEVIARLFNFPRASQSDNVKAPVPPSVSERAMDLRSRAIRINEALATVLEKL